jgi:hypothetical protein
MRMDINSYVAAGAVRFGMDRAAVRAAMGVPHTCFRRVPTATESDAFDAEGVYVEYDAGGACVSVEMASPSVPLFRGRRLIGVPYREIRDWVCALDPAAEEDGAGLTSRLLGIGVYAGAAAKAPDEPVESAIAFCRGYYG